MSSAKADSFLCSANTLETALRPCKAINPGQERANNDCWRTDHSFLPAKRTSSHPGRINRATKAFEFSRPWTSDLKTDVGSPTSSHENIHFPNPSKTDTSKIVTKLTRSVILHSDDRHRHPSSLRPPASPKYRSRNSRPREPGRQRSPNAQHIRAKQW